MSWDTKPIIRTQGDPAPQAFDPVADIYKVVQSTNNAMWTVLKDEAGNFLGVTNGKLNIRASEIETILNTLATAAKQDTIISYVDGIETALGTLNTAVSTAANQTTIIGHVDTLESLVTTLNSYVNGLNTIMTAIRDTAGIKKITDAVTIGSSVLPTGAATSAKQDTIIAAVDGVEGLITTLNTLVTAIRDTSGIKKITDAVDVSDRAARVLGTVVASNKFEYYGPTLTEIPAVATVPIGAVYLAVNTQEMRQSNGTEWVVI